MRFLKAALYFFFVFGVCHSVMAEIRSEVFQKIHKLREEGEIEDAISLISEQLALAKSDQEKDLLRLSLGYFSQMKGQWDKSANVLAIKDQNAQLSEYFYYFLGLSLEKQGDQSGAEEALLKSHGLSTNQKLKNDILLKLAEMDLAQKKYSKAYVHLKKLEPNARGTVDYPRVLMDLAKIEKQMGNKKNFCGRMQKLYTRYPHFALNSDWSIDLSENKFDGEVTGCHFDTDDIRNRVRWLLWSGKKEKALAEVELVRLKYGKADPYFADDMLATYYSSTGEPEKSVQILRPYLKTSVADSEFLINFGSASARAGLMSEAIGSYYEVSKILGTSQKASRALYQSAFLSYQARDYDGAMRKFKEFLSRKGSGQLVQDAKWNLAWIRYLKGDYTGALTDFTEISKSSRADRLNYWIGMTLMRMDRRLEAKNYFQKIAANKLQDFYALAARERLNQISAVSNGIDPRWSRLNLSQVPLPSIEDDYCVVEIKTDTEDSLSLTRDTHLDQAAIQEEVESKAISDIDSGTTEAQACEVPSKEDESAKLNPKIAKQLEKARDLELLGFDDWAKWELYEVERKTKNKDYLKVLMNEYTNLGSYNRASSIGQIYFASERARVGINGSNEIWNFTYPRAYEKEVLKYSQELEVPKELVWGIMRAESQYKKEAISPVGAMGLMQVMPFTADKMAKSFGKKDFSSSELLEPGPAIQIGTAYLSRLSKKFEGNTPLVAAAYNAGPHRAMSWLATFGDLQTDEFVEHIPFLETRNYVKKVMSNCQIYSDLYFGQKKLFEYLPEKVPFNGVAEIQLAESWDDI